MEDRAKKANEVMSDTGKYTGPAFEAEILLADFEHPKHLTVYDLGLADTDKAWHSPLYVLCTIRCIKNLRIRNQDAEHRAEADSTPETDAGKKNEKIAAKFAENRVIL